MENFTGKHVFVPPLRQEQQLANVIGHIYHAHLGSEDESINPVNVLIMSLKKSGGKLTICPGRISNNV